MRPRRRGCRYRPVSLRRFFPATCSGRRSAIKLRLSDAFCRLGDNPRKTRGGAVRSCRMAAMPPPFQSLQSLHSLSFRALCRRSATGTSHQESFDVRSARCGATRRFRPVHGSQLRPCRLRARAWSGFASLGSERARADRLRRRHCGQRAGSLPPGAGRGSDRAGQYPVAHLQRVHQRAGAAPGQEAGRGDLRRARVLLQLRRRGQRGCVQAGPACRP